MMCLYMSNVHSQRYSYGNDASRGGKSETRRACPLKLRLNRMTSPLGRVAMISLVHFAHHGQLHSHILKTASSSARCGFSQLSGQSTARSVSCDSRNDAKKLTPGFTFALEQNKTYSVGRDKGCDIRFDSRYIKPVQGHVAVGDWDPFNVSFRDLVTKCSL